MGEKDKGPSDTSRARGPQVKVTPELLEECLEAIATGQTLTAFCRGPERPHRSAICRHLDRNPELQKRYVEARDRGFDALAEEVMVIADDACEDSKAGVAKAKLQAEVRLRLLSKWCTSRYGDKLQLGGDGGEPIKLSATERVDRLTKFLAVAHARRARATSSSNGHEKNGEAEE